jgi:hypothetical protein
MKKAKWKCCSIFGVENCGSICTKELWRDQQGLKKGFEQTRVK